MIIAGDIGGTKTILGLFEPAPSRPRPLVVRTFLTSDFKDPPSMISVFLDEAARAGAVIDAGCFGVAGPVLGQTASLTNLDWRVDASALAAALGGSRVRLMNDLEAMACGVPALQSSELHTLQPGVPSPAGNIAVIAAGTGLGQALLHNVHGRLLASPSEGGNADFAARTEREIALLRELTSRRGRATVEDVVSGRGLVNIHRSTHGSAACQAAIDLMDADAPAAISRAGLDKRCHHCAEALDLFVDAYAAEAGNLALRTVATGGVYIGGGIAVKILPALNSGAFIRTFSAKPPFEAMLSKIPVKVILNAEVGLLGAAVVAVGLVGEKV